MAKRVVGLQQLRELVVFAPYMLGKAKIRHV
jgi:hypothetical protein